MYGNCLHKYGWHDRCVEMYKLVPKRHYHWLLHERLKSMLEILKDFSDMWLKLGLDKCAKVRFKTVKVFKSNNIVLDINISIKNLHQEEVYKYLFKIEMAHIIQKWTKEKKIYYRRVRMVFQSELYIPNRIVAINSCGNTCCYMQIWPCRIYL